MGIIVNTVKDVEISSQKGVDRIRENASKLELSDLAGSVEKNLKRGIMRCPILSQSQDLVLGITSGNYEKVNLESGLVYATLIVALGGISKAAVKPISFTAQQIHLLDISAFAISSQHFENRGFESPLTNIRVNLNQPTSMVFTTSSVSDGTQTQSNHQTTQDQGTDGGQNDEGAAEAEEKEEQKDGDDLMGNVGWFSGDPRRHAQDENDEDYRHDKYFPSEEEQERDVEPLIQQNRQHWNKNKSRNHYEQERRKERRNSKYERQRANKESWVNQELQEAEDAKFAPVDKEDERRQRKMAGSGKAPSAADPVDAEDGSDGVNSFHGKNDGKKQRFTHNMKR